MFSATDRQLNAWLKLTETVESYNQGLENQFIRDDSVGDDGNDQEQLEMIDYATLEFSLAVIQHPLTRRAFDSVLISFAAVLFWNPHQEA